MKTLELNQMENVQGGYRADKHACGKLTSRPIALITLGAALTFATGGVAAIIGGIVGFGLASGSFLCAFSE